MKKVAILYFAGVIFLLGLFVCAHPVHSGNILTPKVITLDQFKEEAVQASPGGVKPTKSDKNIKEYRYKLVAVEFWADVEYCYKIAATVADMIEKYKGKVKFIRVVTALKGDPDFEKKLWGNLGVPSTGIKTFDDFSRMYCTQGRLFAVPAILLVAPNPGGSKGEVRGCIINADEIIKHLDEAIKSALAE